MRTQTLLDRVTLPMDIHKAAVNAASQGYLDIVKMLLEHLEKVSLNKSALDTTLDAALEAAAYKGHLAIVRLLLTKGLIPKDHLKCMAAYKGHLEVAQVLSNHSAKIQTNLIKVQQRWRKNRLLKAARRAVVFKFELQAVHYSPERLPLLLPGKVNPKEKDSIKRAVKFIYEDHTGGLIRPDK